MAIFDRVFVVQNERESLPGTHLVQKRLDDARIKNTSLKSLFHEHAVCQQKLNKIKRRKNTQWTNTELILKYEQRMRTLESRIYRVLTKKNKPTPSEVWLK